MTKETFSPTRSIGHTIRPHFGCDGHIILVCVCPGQRDSHHELLFLLTACPSPAAADGPGFFHRQASKTKAFSRSGVSVDNTDSPRWEVIVSKHGLTHDRMRHRQLRPTRNRRRLHRVSNRGQATPASSCRRRESLASRATTRRWIVASPTCGCCGRGRLRCPPESSRTSRSCPSRSGHDRVFASPDAWPLLSANDRPGRSLAGQQCFFVRGA